MLSGNYISYQAIIAKVYRNFGFKYDLQPEEALEWLADFIAHANVPKVLFDKIGYSTVEYAKVRTPFDMYLIQQVAKVEGVNNLKAAECGEGTLVPMRWGTDKFHNRYHCDNRDYTSESLHTYTINNNFIFTSFQEGFLAISYKAIPVDECGMPMIPSDEPWQKAAIYELAYRIALKLLIKDEIQPMIFQLIERDRDWYFAQAVNYSKVSMSLDEMESFKNMYVRTIPNIGHHNTFFANMQLPEERYFRPKIGGDSGASSITSTLPANVTISTTST